MYLLDYVILSVILLWLIVAVRYMIRQKKQGRSGCCGSSSPHCANCQKCGTQVPGDKPNENT